MKRKVKLLTIIIILLSLIFLLLIRLNYPLRVSTTESIFHMIPIYYWILLITIPALISITFLLSDSKIICVFLSVIYFFVLYSFNLFFIIPSTQSDAQFAGQIFTILKTSNRLSVQQFSYFQWPIHFLLEIVFQKTLNIDIYIITIGLFSFILMIPLFFSLHEYKLSNNKAYFILPVGYIILSYYFLNLQWVPQFTGLIFLILTICCYVKYKRVPSRKFYSLIVFFYMICVLTHPFIFVFFPATIFLDRYIISKGFFISFDKDNNKISLISLVVIYFIGYLFRFIKIRRYTRRLIYPEEGRGEAWGLLSNLLGFEGDAGVGPSYETHPLWHLVSKRTYLISRYSALLLLVGLSLVLAYILLNNLKKVESFDISLGVASGGFFVFGLVNPVLLGQRGFQVAFLKVPRYFSDLFKSKRKILAVILVIAITLTPLIFTINIAVNQSFSGGRFFQDRPTLESGSFIDDYAGNDTNVLVADRYFYPSSININIYHPRIMAREELNLTEVEIIVNSSKLTNRMEYHGFETEYGKTSQIYDIGDAQILVQKRS